MNMPTYRLEKVIRTREDEQLEDFEGPLDLILHLLSKNKMEIKDIQISVILEQYLSWMNTRKQLDKMDRLLKKYPVEESDYLVNFTGQTSYKFNEMFKKEVYGNGKLYQFESFSLMGPEQYDAYLKSLYGDYMTPPREEDRNAHAAELVPIEEVD